MCIVFRVVVLVSAKLAKQVIIIMVKFALNLVNTDGHSLYCNQCIIIHKIAQAICCKSKNRVFAFQDSLAIV